VFEWLLKRRARAQASDILWRGEIRVIALSDAIADEAIDLARWGGLINEGRVSSNVIGLSHAAIRALKGFRMGDDEKASWERLRERWFRYGGRLPPVQSP